jgi:flagellar biosynthesis protein
VNRDRFFDMRKPRDARPSAAALRYDPVKTAAPEVVAVGRGFVADEIISLAKKHKIPIHADRGLVEALSRLEVGAVIPRELYVVVAEVLAWVYRLDAAATAAQPQETSAK